MVRRAGPCDARRGRVRGHLLPHESRLLGDARRGRVRDYRWSGAPAEDLRRGLGTRHLGPVGQQHTTPATTQARRRPVTVPDGHRTVSQPRSGRVGKARPEAAMGAGTDELIVGDRGLDPHVDTGTGPGWSLRTPKHSSTLTWTHGDRGGGIARGAHRPGTSHAAAGPGGSRTARTSQHGDPLTQPQGPAPETPRRTTSLRQPSRTRGSQPRELWRYRLLGGDLHALAGARPPPRWSPRRRLPTLARPREPGPNASFPTRWHGDPHTAAGASPPPRATRPPARSRPYALAGAGTPRWDQGHAREADPTRPQGPAPATEAGATGVSDPTQPQGPGSSSWRTSGPPPGRRTPPSRPGSPGRSRGSS